MTYTHGHHESVLRSHRWRTAANSAAYLLPRLQPGMSVLDIGCGPGTITADLARLVAPGRVLGIDQAPDIIEQAQADHAAPNLAFAVGDVYELDTTTRYDVVHAHQVLQHLPDPVGALRAMRKAADLVAVRDADYAAMTWHPADAALDRWLELYRDVARRNQGEPDAGRHLLHWANQAGFDHVEPSASVWCFATPDDRQWWGGLWADRITSSAIARHALDAGLATQEELDDIAAAWRRWADHPDGWFAVVHGELLCR